MDGAVTASSDPNQPRTVDGGHGVTWWTDAWALFTKNAAIWIVLGLILLIILIVLAVHSDRRPARIDAAAAGVRGQLDAGRAKSSRAAAPSKRATCSSPSRATS